MPMTDENVLAAYADGSDLDAVAARLRAAFIQFVDSGLWQSDQACFVDLRQSLDATAPEFLPQWDLGLNLGLDHLSRSPDWLRGLKSLVGLLQQLHAELDREFVIFLCFRSEPWRQEHLAFVGSGEVDLTYLCEAIERMVLRAN